MNHEILLELQSIALNAAQEAGKFIERAQTSTLKKEMKANGFSEASKIVTEIDLQAQEVIYYNLKRSISKYDLGFLGEESAYDLSYQQKEYFWCVDPLDGTLAFTQGTDGYAVSIALMHQSGEVLVASVYLPHKQQTYSAVKNGSVQKNGKAFKRKFKAGDHHFYFLIDNSLEKKPFFPDLKTQLNLFCRDHGFTPKYNIGKGAVFNALEVLEKKQACYFKIAKAEDGGGSTWDFAATKLIFSEAALLCSNAQGEELKLLAQSNHFLNRQGVIFSTSVQLQNLIIRLNKQYGIH